jgi:hypothetical protein
MEFTVPLPEDLRGVLADIEPQLLHALENTEPLDDGQDSNA